MLLHYSFGIDENVYISLVQRYSDQTHKLAFPPQTISVLKTTIESFVDIYEYTRSYEKLI